MAVDLLRHHHLGVGNWLVYPAWPLISSSTQGVFGWHSRTAVEEQLKDLKTLRRASSAKLDAASLEQIEKTPELLSLARAEGKVAFADNCAPCHGAGGGGAKGFPNLNDDDWLWGGTLPQIEATIAHGIRSGDDAGHQATCALHGRSEPRADVGYGGLCPLAVRSRAGQRSRRGAGRVVFKANCAVCHGENGKGNIELGSKNLTDGICCMARQGHHHADHRAGTRRRDAPHGPTAFPPPPSSLTVLRPHAGRRAIGAGSRRETP